jgi:hypothetical protein
MKAAEGFWSKVYCWGSNMTGVEIRKDKSGKNSCITANQW